MASGAVCTVRVVTPVTPASNAEIVVVPADTPLARPAAVIVATAGLDEIHVAWLVIFSVLPSEYVPVAANGCEVPVRRVGFAGVTAMDVSVRAGPAAPTA